MEMSLDLNVAYAPTTPDVSELLHDAPHSEDGTQKTLKPEDVIKMLEQEMMKINGFKHELPLCMLLVQDAIAILKGDTEHKPGFDEFISLKTNSGGQVQQDETNNSTGPLLPFNGNSSAPEEVLQHDNLQAPSLGFMTPALEMNPGNSNTDQSQPRQNRKKQRRCWSSDLHNNFVEVIRQLGGPDVAKPKQIRERMQVQGLTNAEVRSHLQKYRIHLKKLAPASICYGHGGLCIEQGQIQRSITHAGSSQGPRFLGVSANGLSSYRRSGMRVLKIMFNPIS